jgi:DNA-binding MarR family transcriptional regulator
MLPIEEATKMKQNFRNEWQKATNNILFTSYWLANEIKTHIQKVVPSLTMQQYNVLRILKGNNPRPLNTNEIRDRMLDKMSDASRLVDRMVVKGLVEKRTNEIDKRLSDITLTKKGLKTVKDLDAIHTNVDNILGNLTSDEAQTLNYLLDKLHKQ